MSHRFVSRLSTLGLCLLTVGSLAACQGGSTGTSNPGPSVANEEQTLTKLVDAFKKFHDDTGAWPMGGLAWHADSVQDPQIDPIMFDQHDTALFKLPTNMKQCGADQAKPCWNGPYLTGTSLADAAFNDAWGRTHYFSLIRPMDGNGGGIESVPDGVVLLWSAGADGVDGVGCTDASCAVNWDLLGKGMASAPKADDVITVVGKTRTTTTTTN